MNEAAAAEAGKVGSAQATIVESTEPAGVEADYPRVVAPGLAPSVTEPLPASHVAGAADDSQRRAAGDAAARAAATARAAAARAAAEKVAAVNAARDTDADLDIVRPSASAPQQAAVDGSPTPARYLAPSATHQTLGSIGAGRPAGVPATPIGSAAGAASTPRLSPAPALSPALAFAQSPGPAALSGRSGPFVGRAMPPPAPVAPMTRSDQIKATLASIAAEPKGELVATGLTALGGALALVAFALPWTAENGIGIGTTDIHPRPGAWAFDTAGGWPLFFIAVILLASILASDRLEELLPGLAPTIRRLTEVTVPMLLGGMLLGVGLLYQLLPWGCGAGILPLMFGAALLVAGSIVGLFYPAGERKD